MTTNMDEDVEVQEQILYDLSVHCEWQLDSETVVRNFREKKNVTLPKWISSMTHRIGWTVLRSVGVNARPDMPCMLPVGLLKLVNNHLHWHIDVTRDGKHVAFLQDQDLEIRSAFDDFSGVTGKASLNKKDPYPQWRRVSWNHDGDMVACSDSLGQVYIFDLFCTPICTIPCEWVPQPNAPIDLSRAICALIFKPCENNKKWNCELIVVNYQGTLKKYYVSREGDHQLIHSFTFSRHYPKGIGAVLYQEKHGVLLVGGCGDRDVDEDTPDSQKYGLTSWRMLSGSPHYKIVTDYEQDLYEAQQQRRVMRRLKSMTRMSWWYGDKEEDGICGLALSPSGHILTSLHQSGRLSLWDVPSLRLRKTWALDEQPNYDEVNQTIAENPKKRKMMKEHLKAFWLADTNWWSDQSVILSRGTGAVTVANAENLHNLLGESPQWFEPGPILTKTHDGGFLSLECHCKYESLKRHLADSDGSGSEDEYEDSEDEMDLDLIQRSTRMLKYGVYYVTDMERFQPPRKRPKLVTRTYRLLCLKSTTPDELYTKRINNEEYGEALALAKAYGLDCDRVYKRQWEKTPVSVASIQDYLSKISKRSWVLHECLERVPRNIDAMRELLKYALRGTDLEALITIGKGEDQGRFIFCDRGDVYEESIDFYDIDAQEDFKQREKQRTNELLAQIDFNKLTLEQRELCRARIRILQFLDRLSTYEEILGGIHAAEERYDHKFFESFRSKNIVDLALDYTRKCDWRALETLFSYHGNDLLPYRLPIVANFPETFPPTEYRSLLPEVGSRSDDPAVLKWVEYQWRESDWVEYTDIRKAIDSDELDLGVTLTEECPEYVKFKGLDLSGKHLTEWHIQRARQIEDLSRQVDYALELVNLGIERGVIGLDVLQNDLITMETLVYECHIEDSLGLDDIQNMPDIDKIRLMMSRSSEEMFVKNVRRWLVPFLERCTKDSPTRIHELLREYMVTMATTDLTLCLKIFETSKSDLVKPVISDELELIALALECIYTCTATDQLANAFGILECLPQKGYGMVSESLSRLHTQIDELECHLSAAEILEKHQMEQTVAFFKETQNDKDAAVQLLTKLLRVSGRKEPVLVEEDWRDLLKDMLSLRDRVYRNLSTAQCYQIFVESLLTTGRHEDIRLAGHMMESTHAEAQEPDYTHLDNKEYGQFEKVSYKRAVELVLTAASEYFDASSNLSDSNMELARACLNLIKDSPPEIIAELDLIDSLSLLDGFGVKVLPVQVRMSSNRIELVKKAVYEKPYTYKNSQRLLKLASLLHIPHTKPQDVEGQVLRLVTQCALGCSDLAVAYENCQRLMEAGYAPVWEECKLLAQKEDFSNIQAKTDLLAFAVTYCSPDMIEPILNAKLLLETQISCECVQEQLHHQGRDSQSPPRNASRDSESPPSQFSQRSVSGALQQTRDILSSTNKATRSMLSHVSDKSWWKKTLTSINSRRQVSSAEEKDDRNKDFNRTGCHPFYAGVIQNAYENRTEADYSSICLPATEQGDLSVSELILRTGKQEETLTDGESFQPTNDVILQLAESCVKEDAALGLAYLLALPQVDSADHCLTKQPKTAISLQLAVYYYALQIYQWLRRDEMCKNADVDAVYLQSPAEVMALVMRLVKKGEVKGCDELVSKMRLYHEKLLDYTQAQKLKQLAKGVDLGRFTDDDEYKKETILGLAMSSEQSVYDLSLSLAKRYNIPVWEVHITQLEALFESGLTLEEIEKRVTHLDILRTLKSKPEDFYSRMSTYVFPGLAGTDHEMLLYYYSLLEGCPVPQGEAEPQQHVKLLRKISGIASDLDYKKLTDLHHSPLEVIRPVLTSDNIHQIAKLASKIPTQDGGFLQPSLVFCAWAVKHFWEGTSTGKKAATAATPKSPSEWIHRYESCHEYSSKVSAEDMLQFVDAVLFTDESLDKLSLDCRQEILKRALKFSKQQKNKNKGTETEWSVTVKTLTEYQDHLQLLCSEYLLEMWDSDDQQEKNYARTFDLSRSNKRQVENLLVQMAVDGRSVDFIEQFLQEVTVTGWSVATVYKESLSRLTQAARNNKIVEEETCEMKQLKTVVDRISESITQGNDAVSLEDVMSVLRPFCADAGVDVSTRLSVLKTLETGFELDDRDLSLLLVYRTDAIVTSQWPLVKVSEAEVSSDSEREACFYRLLAQSQQVSHVMALARLLQVWPPLKALTARSGDPEHYPYCELVSKLVSVSERKEEAATEVIGLLKGVRGTQELSAECVLYIFDTLCVEHLEVTAIKCALLFEHKQPHDRVIEKLHTLTQHEDVDNEVMELLLKCHLLSSIVSTPFYPCVTQYLLSKQEGEVPYYLNMDNLANELLEAGYQAEAGSLIMEYRGLHPSLRTFGMAFTAISRWFQK